MHIAPSKKKGITECLKYASLCICWSLCSTAHAAGTIAVSQGESDYSNTLQAQSVQYQHAHKFPWSFYVGGGMQLAHAGFSEDAELVSQNAAGNKHPAISKKKIWPIFDAVVGVSSQNDSIYNVYLAAQWSLYKTMGQGLCTDGVKFNDNYHQEDSAYKINWFSNVSFLIGYKITPSLLPFVKMGVGLGSVSFTNNVKFAYGQALITKSITSTAKQKYFLMGLGLQLKIRQHLYFRLGYSLRKYPEYTVGPIAVVFQKGDAPIMYTAHFKPNLMQSIGLKMLWSFS